MARCGTAAEVAAMLDAGVDVNARTRTGFTALLAAAGVRQDTTVRLLLDRGADPRRDGDPLLRFSVRRSPEMVDLLLAHGAGRPLRSIAELKRGGDFSG